MIKSTLTAVVLTLCASLFSPVWAASSSNCIFDDSGVDLGKIKTSGHVLGFEEIEKNARYTGNLKGVGGFYLELFGCTHYGARLTVLLGPDNDITSLNTSLMALPDLLFAEADSLLVKNELWGLQLQTDSPTVFLEDLAKSLGLTQIIVQLVEAEGMGLLVFQFYGG